MSDIEKIEEVIRIAETVKKRLDDVQFQETQLEERNKKLIIQASKLQDQEAKINRRHSEVMQLQEKAAKESGLFDLQRKEIDKAREDVETDKKTTQKVFESVTEQNDKLDKRKDQFKDLEMREITVKAEKELMEKEKTVLREKKAYLDIKELQLTNKADKLQAKIVS